MIFFFFLFYFFYLFIYWIAASVAKTVAVHPSDIKTLVASGLSTFPIKGNLAFSNDPKSLPKNSLDYPILCKWIFEDCILSEKLFTKVLQSLETWVLVNDNLCGKLFTWLKSLTTFEEIF